MKCYIPGCKSSPKKRDKEKQKLVNNGISISFHEFPFDLELRAKWLKVISRKDSLPGDRAVVCSLHFLPNDYKQGTKIKTLIKGAVPSIFPTYPKYMQPKRKKLRTTASIDKREENKKYSEIEAAIKIEYLPLPPEESEQQSTLIDAAVQVDVIDNKKEAQLTTLNQAYHLAMKKLQLLQGKYDTVYEKYLEYKLSKDIHSFINVKKEAEDGKESAIFLLDQVKNYGKKNGNWSEVSIHNCALWRQCSPKAYIYARENNILKLPSYTTLKKNMLTECQSSEVTVLDQEDTSSSHHPAEEL